jgi:hypothetical protein
MKAAGAAGAGREPAGAVLPEGRGAGGDPAAADPAEGAFEFKVPTLPPLPPLRCIDGDVSGAARGKGRGKGGATAIEPEEAQRKAAPGSDSAVSDVSYIDAPPAGPTPPPAQSLTIPAAPRSPEPSVEVPSPQGHVIEFTSVPPGQGGGSAAAGAARTATVAGAADAAAEAEEAQGGKRKAPGIHLPPRPWEKPYSVPVDGLLNAYPDGQYWIIDEKTKKSAEILQETLAEFGIKAEVTGIRKGPVITMFEILPAPGVRLSKIANLADNIALRLAASSVRIVAPIPGKHAVGIEVPNERRSTSRARSSSSTSCRRPTSSSRAPRARASRCRSTRSSSPSSSAAAPRR